MDPELDAFVVAEGGFTDLTSFLAQNHPAIARS
jgi:hypothetical protein